MDDDDVTELTMLDATKVAGVATPANGTPFLLLKAAAADVCSTCKGKGTIMDGNRDCPDCSGPASKAEADDQEDEMTEDDGDAEKAEADDIESELTKGAYCGDPDCDVCLDLMVKDLSDKDRNAMPASSFAFVDKNGGKHLPIHDVGHVQAAMGRLSTQDFSNAKGDPDKAKSKAAGKIKAAAGKFGMDVDSKSDVGVAAADDTSSDDAAKKGDVQDALGGTRTPVEAGHLDTGKSHLAGPVADQEKTLPSLIPSNREPSGNPGPTVVVEGGETTYQTNEDKINGPAIANPGAYVKAIAVASLAEAIERIGSDREAIKDGLMGLSTPTPEQSSTPGNMPWESYDGATLDQVAHVLASAGCALDAIAKRESIEAAMGNPGDSTDAWALGDAEQALEYALGVAARLAYGEAAAANNSAAKSEGPFVPPYGRLNYGDGSALRFAADNLGGILAAQTTASSSGSTEEDVIVTEVTKGELAELVVQAVKEVNKEERKARKAAKRAAEEEAAKNANNDGDVTAADVHATSEHDAEDVQSVGGSVDGTYVNKGMADQLEEFQKSVTETLADLQEKVTKMGKRPRSGGPVLDGVPRPAAEGRLSETVTKSGEGNEAIEKLEKQLEVATDPQVRQDLSLQITREKLVEAHLRGEI